MVVSKGKDKVANIDNEMGHRPHLTHAILLTEEGLRTDEPCILVLNENAYESLHRAQGAKEGRREARGSAMHPDDGAVLRELAVASTASILGGFGIVALFCSVGVYV